MTMLQTFEHLRIAPSTNVRLSDYGTRTKADFASKSDARKSLSNNQSAIAQMQDMLYASKRNAMLVVLQGMDTSGKSGTLKVVFAHTSPEGMAVQSFKKPTPNEAAHDYLWRAHKAAPKRGNITIFDRSHYEDVLVAKVRGFADPATIEKRYQQINDFERHLVENGTIILKFMLNISHAEQGKRLHERLKEPHKKWKFNPGDLDDRALWPDFINAYEVMLPRCSTAHAPWYIIPADSRTRRNAYIAAIVRQTLGSLNLTWPEGAHTLTEFEGKI